MEFGNPFSLNGCVRQEENGKEKMVHKTSLYQ